MLWKITLICHPVWQYLNQPIFDAQLASAWSPRLFWYIYRVQLLESCWNKDTNSESHQAK